MGLILNIETATTVCSVSLGKDGQLIALKELDGEYTHAENLTLFVQDVLKQAGHPLSALDAIAVSKGPGSYTGLRIGVSTAKGLCYSLNKPLIAVNTLQHMALSVSTQIESLLPDWKGEAPWFCPMIDARRMEVYCAVFDKESNFITPTAAVIVDDTSFAGLLPAGDKRMIFFGDGAGKCREIFASSSKAVFIDRVMPSAKSMVGLSEKAYRENQFEDVAYFEPFYLKDFVAGKKKAQPEEH